MGHKIPNPDTDEPGIIPNPIFPPDQTPLYIELVLAGIYWAYPQYPYPWPMLNGKYKLTQISGEIWAYQGYLYAVSLTINSEGCRVFAAYGGDSQFLNTNPEPFTFFMQNGIVPPLLGFLGGTACWCAYPEFLSIPEKLGIPLAQPTFGELVGSNVRIAQRAQGTCVYIKRVDGV